MNQTVVVAVAEDIPQIFLRNTAQLAVLDRIKIQIRSRYSDPIIVVEDDHTVFWNTFYLSFEILSTKTILGTFVILFS